MFRARHVGVSVPCPVLRAKDDDSRPLAAASVAANRLGTAEDERAHPSAGGLSAKRRIPADGQADGRVVVSGTNPGNDEQLARSKWQLDHVTGLQPVSGQSLNHDAYESSG